jgi:hypothetical protein
LNANATTDTTLDSVDPFPHCGIPVPILNTHSRPDQCTDSSNCAPSSRFWTPGILDEIDGLSLQRQTRIVLPNTWSKSISNTINPICNISNTLISQFGHDGFTFRRTNHTDSLDLTPPTIHNAFIGVAYIPK